MPNQPFVHNLAVLPLEKAAHLRLPGQDRRDELARDLLLHLVRVGHVPLLQAELALPAEQQHKLHLAKSGSKSYQYLS